MTCSQKSLLLSCFPFKVRISTLRLCSAGSRCLLFPGVIAHMRCSDFLIILGLSSGSPRCWPTPLLALCSWPDNAQASRRVPVGDWSPAPHTAGILMGNDRDLPVYRIAPSIRAPVTHAARSAVPSPLSAGDDVAAFRRNKAFGSWKKTFSTLIVAARMPVYLRINIPVARYTARLTYGLPGSALAVRGSHPLDD